MSDDLTLRIGNKLITGWDNIRVTRSIERLPSDFSLSLMDLYPGSDNQQWVNPGDPCVVNLGDDWLSPRSQGYGAEQVPGLS